MIYPGSRLQNVQVGSKLSIRGLMNHMVIMHNSTSAVIKFANTPHILISSITLKKSKCGLNTTSALQDGRAREKDCGSLSGSKIAVKTQGSHTF